MLVAILRAGLGLVDGFLRLVPDARVGHLGMYRDEEALRPVGYYENIPSGVADAEVFVVDPMLATGGSCGAGDRPPQARGRAADHVRVPGGRPRGREGAAVARTPTCRSCTAALDRELDDNGYIRPGLGDAGDRIFGTDR